ncbi:MAG TPA: 2-oxoacid:acceptor oxidoreductase family protein [Anaerolineae bacterium]|nr:2-oxoacid:acceptor oxidoreductase family protein [Anaerolineae bacterium]HQJ50738.1 2-oxoacid:acceptor oxidoreductase family protein [Anaerolineae bacterium]
MAKMTEIRWHGRAGQGIVTASELLAEAALKEGKYFQAFPEYGPERMGAPIKAYTRISDEPIEIHYQILNPEVVVVVNPNLLGVIDVTEGLAADGVLVVNTPESPAQVRQRLHLVGKKVRVFAVDATRIALETIRRDIPATLMLGAVIRAAGLVKVENILHLIEEKLGAKLRSEVVQSNVTALRRAYEEVQEG